LPWVLRIAHNLSIDHFRRGKKMPMVRSTDEYDVFDTIRHPDENVEQIFAQEDIRQALGKLVLALPPEQEEVVRMRIERDLSFKEIAEETGVSINTALGRMRYALINLRRMMEEKGVELTVN
jgi:RNA polymerase sigma-70 factor (ECF subfamily)